MMRLRNPVRDDAAIHDLVKIYLLPFARLTDPSVRLDRNELKARLDRGITYVAEKKDGTPGGFILFVINGNELWVDMLAVDQSEQGRGAGSALLHGAEEYAWRNGCTVSNLFVDRINTKAQHFYSRRGYYQGAYVPKVDCYTLTKRFN